MTHSPLPFFFFQKINSSNGQKEGGGYKSRNNSQQHQRHRGKSSDPLIITNRQLPSWQEPRADIQSHLCVSFCSEGINILTAYLNSNINQLAFTPPTTPFPPPGITHSLVVSGGNPYPSVSLARLSTASSFSVGFKLHYI